MGPIRGVSAMGVVRRFSRYYFGDELLNRIEIDVKNNQAYLYLSGALLLKDGGNIFNPETSLRPATILFTDCDEFSISPGAFAMNNTIVKFHAIPHERGRTEFRWSLTGGRDNETFWREFEVSM